MPISLRILLVTLSFLTLMLIASRIKKSKLRLFDGFAWLLISTISIIISIFPQIIVLFSNALGIQSPIHLVLLLVVFYLFIVLFYTSLRISNLESQVMKLAQEVAIRDERFNYISTSDDMLEKTNVRESQIVNTEDNL